MRSANKQNMGQSLQVPMLSIEDIDKHECFKDWPQEKKEKLIKFVYQLSFVLYTSYYNEHEQP